MFNIPWIPDNFKILSGNNPALREFHFATNEIEAKDFSAFLELIRDQLK
jgi:hypothetical protein